MKMARLSYNPKSRWSQPLPDLDSPNTMVLAFYSPELAKDGAWLQELKAKYPRSQFVGCSTAGEIHGAVIEDHTASVAITKFEHTHLKTAMVRVDSAEASNDAGAKLAAELKADGLKFVFVVSDGLKVNGSALIRGLNTNLPQDVIVTGGLAGDGPRFGETSVLSGAHFGPGVVTAVGFYGSSLTVGYGSQGGWDFFGPERTITKSKDNVLYELDGQPALDLYKTYLGARAAELPASGLLFPLQIRQGLTDEKRLVRTILAVDEQAKSLTFAGDIPQGWHGQLMKSNFDRLVDGASSAASQAHPGKDQNPVLAIAISCVGRRLVLKDRSEEEIEATLSNLPKGSEQIGFYSYGELAPYAQFHNCELHNQTMTITVLKEAA